MTARRAAAPAGEKPGWPALTQSVAVELVRAEAACALHLLRAVRVLKGDVNPARRPVYPRAVVQQVFDETQAERRLRGVNLTFDRNKMDGPPLAGDEDMLVASIGALVVAAPALLDGQSPRTVLLSVTTRSDGAVVFVADHEGAELPLFWRSILAGTIRARGRFQAGPGLQRKTPPMWTHPTLPIAVPTRSRAHPAGTAS